jgi:hypothetical protein
MAQPLFSNLKPVLPVVRMATILLVGLKMTDKKGRKFGKRRVFCPKLADPKGYFFGILY